MAEEQPQELSEENLPPDPEKLRQKFEVMSQMGLFPSPKMMRPGKVYVVNFNTSGEARLLFDRLDSSPNQPREEMESESSTLKNLAEDIEKVGLLTPILIRLKLDENLGDPEKFRFEIIAGHRRVAALLLHSIEKEIQVRIYIVDDLEAHHMLISDNIQRKQLTAVEVLKALIKLADQHLQERAFEYPMEEAHSAKRLFLFLNHTANLHRKKEKGEELGEKAKFYNTNIVKIEEIFQNLPKPLNWLSFVNNDLPVILNSEEIVLKRASQLSLNKKQIKAYQKIYQAAVGADQLEAFDQLENIKEKSSRELLLIAERFKKQARSSKAPVVSQYSKDAMIHHLKRAGYSQHEIAGKLNLNLSTVNSKLLSNTFPLLIQQEINQGKSPKEVAKIYKCPESLILDVILKDKSDQDRIKEINWELKTQARWNWSKGDLRFAEHEMAEVQPQLIAHMLYYFIPEGALLLEAIAENSMVSQVCVFLNRRCRSFSTPEKAEQYPSLSPHVWGDPLEWIQEETELPNAVYLKQNQYWPAHQLESFFELARENSQENGKLFYLYQERFAGEVQENNLGLAKVLSLLSSTGWSLETWIDCSNSIYQPKKEERQQLIDERKIVGNRRLLMVAM